MDCERDASMNARRVPVPQHANELDEHVKAHQPTQQWPAKKEGYPRNGSKPAQQPNNRQSTANLTCLGGNGNRLHDTPRGSRRKLNHVVHIILQGDFASFHCRAICPIVKGIFALAAKALLSGV
jgi:hypothetical protein